MLEKDFTLNKTEFVAYLKCPFLFYLTRELYKKSNSLPRININDYESFLQNGIKKHRWLRFFYKKYATDILNGIYPALPINERNETWKKQFIEFEINRYNSNPIFWKPAAVELYLSNSKYSGKIDRIDVINEDGHCRIVEYK